MSTFNLKQWIKQAKKTKTVDVSLTEKQLRDKDTAEGPDNNSITEKQLEANRADEKAKTTEQRLEAVRTGSSELTTEGELNKAGKKQRNEKAHLGNVPKLEEKRLSHSPVEEQKTKAISEIPLEARIEKMDSGKDGMKLASKEKTAQLAESSDIGDFDFSYGEPDERERQHRVQEMMDEPTGLSSVTEDDEKLKNALEEFGFDDVDNVEEDKDWEEIKSDLIKDPDSTEGMFREKSEVSKDEDTGERFLSGELSFDVDDPLFRSKTGDINTRFIVQKAIEHIRSSNPEFIVTRDNFDLSQIDMGIVKFLATETYLATQ